MAKHSAGILMYRFRNGNIEIFLVHPGGPYWAKKDKGAWSIPKGEINDIINKWLHLLFSYIARKTAPFIII